MRIRRPGFWGAMSACLLLPSGRAAAVLQAARPPLADILSRTAAYCERLDSAALFFVCRERIREDVYPVDTRSLPERARHPAVAKRADLVYDYQLLRLGPDVRDRRRVAANSGSAAAMDETVLRTRRFLMEKAVYGPIGFVGRESQAYLEYRFRGEERALGRRAYVLDSRPRLTRETSPNFGTIWVDAEDSSVLRLSLDQGAIIGIDQLTERAAAVGMTPEITAVYEFGERIKGLRFPSRAVIDEWYDGARLVRFRQSRTVVDYTGYRFFTVEVSVAERGIDRVGPPR